MPWEVGLHGTEPVCSLVLNDGHCLHMLRVTTVWWLVADLVPVTMESLGSLARAVPCQGGMLPGGH